jgi:hypothetical protein
VKEITKAPIDGTLEEGFRCPLPGGTAPRRETHSLNDCVLEGEGDKKYVKEEDIFYRYERGVRSSALCDCTVMNGN